VSFPDPCWKCLNHGVVLLFNTATARLYYRCKGYYTGRQNDKNYVGSENHFPHQLRKSHVEPGTAKFLHHKEKNKINGNQEGCRLDLKPAPDDS
jgi:hypothetical protein